jgi:hypothetical protein
MKNGETKLYAKKALFKRHTTGASFGKDQVSEAARFTVGHGVRTRSSKRCSPRTTFTR